MHANAEFLDKELPPCIAVPILRALSEMTATRSLHPELRPFIGCGTLVDLVAQVL